eukprot:2746601-Rhodomonas_salina.1
MPETVGRWGGDQRASGWMRRCRSSTCSSTPALPWPSRSPGARSPASALPAIDIVGSLCEKEEVRAREKKEGWMEMKGGRLGNGEGRRRRSEDGDVEGERKE